MSDDVISCCCRRPSPAKSARRRDPVTGSWRISDLILRKLAEAKPSEWQFMQAYLTLFVLPANNGLKTVSVARFGVYEVRLIEFCELPEAETPLPWIELYAHDDRSSLDSFACEEFAEAVAVAEHFIARARDLHQQSRAAWQDSLCLAF